MTDEQQKAFTERIKSAFNSSGSFKFPDDPDNELDFIAKEKKIYIEDQCPCGSGKKYKKCCGR